MLLREGIVRLLRDEGFDVCGQAGDAEELLRLVDETGPDIAIVDIRMPPGLGDDGIRATQSISAATATRSASSSCRSTSSRTSRCGCSRTAAAGSVTCSRTGSPTSPSSSKPCAGSPAAARSSIRRSSASCSRAGVGDPLEALTEREREVLALMAEGYSNQAIAARMSLSEKTIESYNGAIFGKLALEPAPDVHRRVLAVLTFLQAR